MDSVKYTDEHYYQGIPISVLIENIARRIYNILGTLTYLFLFRPGLDYLIFLNPSTSQLSKSQSLK